MGKPFQSELESLVETINWASQHGSPNTNKAWLDSSTPAYCIGSGGSQSTADFLARLIRAEGGFSVATTPLEYLHLQSARGPSSAFFLSASGRNKDILAAAKYAIASEAVQIGALVTTQGSPLGSLVSSYSRGSTFEMPPPTGKDGFLATNSLIAMMVSLLRLSSDNHLAKSFDSLIETANETASQPLISHLIANDLEIVIIYAGWGGSAAMDLESKLSEAALAPSMVCDLRNFGHGRHHWLAKRGRRTLVVTVEDRKFVALFNKTLDLLPRDIQVLRLQSKCTGPSASIDLTIRAFGLVRDLGTLQGIDPGRPGVPEFGRKIYHLSPGSASTRRSLPIERAANRKAKQYPSAPSSLLTTLKASATQAKTALESLELRGIVFDFDGTLVDTVHRFQPVCADVTHELTRLLRIGIQVGIATGRGKSVREALRQALPVDTWSMVTVGYYNGSETITLDEERLPDNSTESGELKDIRDMLLSDPWIKSVGPTLELRPRQLSISGAGCPNSVLWAHISRLLNLTSIAGLKCFSSTHSVDILTSEASKRSVIEIVRERASCNPSEILCIGDSGLWPGNDAELLSHNPSLSCGSSSMELETGWNFAPEGVLESKATLFYLTRMRAEKGKIKVHIED